MADLRSCPTFDKWSLAVGVVGNISDDVDTYKSWHADGGVPFSGSAASRGLFACASKTISSRVGAHAAVTDATAVAGLAVARTLLSHATMVSNWPGMRNGSGVGSEKLVMMACDEVAAIFSALGLVRMAHSSASRVLRVGVICGKVGMYLRYVDKLGVVACGGKDAWEKASDAFFEAETMLAVSCLAASCGVDSDTAARDLARELVSAASLWDMWQMRHAPRNALFEEPDGSLVDASEITSCMYGWCRLSGRHPVDCVLPMKSSFRSQAMRTYDAVTIAKRNAGKTWAQYR